MIVTVIPAIIDSVTQVIIQSPIIMVMVVGRQMVDPVAIVVVSTPIEASGTVEIYEIPVAGMHPGCAAVVPVAHGCHA